MGSLEDMLVVYMDEEKVGGKFLKEYNAQEIGDALDFCTIQIDEGFIKYIDLAELDDNPKVRFDQLFEVQSRWLGADLEKFFKQITHKELSFAQLSIKYCRRTTDKNQVYFVL